MQRLPSAAGTLPRVQRKRSGGLGLPDTPALIGAVFPLPAALRFGRSARTAGGNFGVGGVTRLTPGTMASAAADFAAGDGPDEAAGEPLPVCAPASAEPTTETATMIAAAHVSRSDLLIG